MADYFGPFRPFQGDSSLAFLTQIDGQYFEFIPRSLFEKGLVVDDVQYFFPQVLRPDFYSSLESSSTFVDVNELAGVVGEDLVKDLREKGYQDQTGYLIPMSESDGKLISWTDSYLEKGLDNRKLGSFEDPQSGITFKTGPITGLGERDGQRFYSFEAENPNLTSVYGMYTYDPSSDRAGGGVHWYDYDPGPSWAKPLRAVGYGLIGLGTAGLAGFGPLAAGAGGAATGGAALGSGLSTTAAGTTGLTTGAAGLGLSAPAGFTLAPSVGATVGGAGAGLLGASNFYGVGETGLIPGAAEGLQIPTAPGLSSMGGGTGLLAPVEGGMVSQLGFVPVGATPALGDPSSFINDPNLLDNTVFSTDYLAAPAAAGAAAAGGSQLSNALLASSALMGQPQQAQQMGMGGGRQPGSVDYSGVLGLLQQQARTPGVSSLAVPAQLQPMFQPTLLPNVMSLLG